MILSTSSYHAQIIHAIYAFTSFSLIAVYASTNQILSAATVASLPLLIGRPSFFFVPTIPPVPFFFLPLLTAALRAPIATTPFLPSAHFSLLSRALYATFRCLAHGGGVIASGAIMLKSISRDWKRFQWWDTVGGSLEERSERRVPKSKKFLVPLVYPMHP